MSESLNPQETEQFKDALLSAYPDRGTLEQMFFFGLGQRLANIAGNTYDQLVFNLVQWAETHAQTEVLLNAARKYNTGNRKLIAFEQTYRAARSPSPSLELRNRLVGLLLQIPTTGSFDSRTALLSGIPSPNLVRQAGMQYDDLTEIVNQLSQLGQLESGEWPLIILLDNALTHVKGVALAAELRAVREALVEVYEEA